MPAQNSDTAVAIENPIPNLPAQPIDLGLSVKWASWNVGASSPEDYGGLYGWADPTGNNTSTNNTENISDRRNSNTPQNQLQNVRDGSYVTNYNYDTDNVKSNDSSNSKGLLTVDD